MVPENGENVGGLAFLFDHFYDATLVLGWDERDGLHTKHHVADPNDEQFRGTRGLANALAIVVGPTGGFKDLRFGRAVRRSAQVGTRRGAILFRVDGAHLSVRLADVRRHEERFHELRRLLVLLRDGASHVRETPAVLPNIIVPLVCRGITHVGLFHFFLDRRLVVGAQLEPERDRAFRFSLPQPRLEPVGDVEAKHEDRGLHQRLEDKKPGVPDPYAPRDVNPERLSEEPADRRRHGVAAPRS
mmetsp:Transcript_57925/g.161658  ORF Transcript_57925/g.161658 Transcript_57925/m.161658 type:complete len:244 (+) Transcript_57925:1152-1883(+)